MQRYRADNTIPGYVHPETINSQRDGIYKTFTEGEKKKAFGTTILTSQYGRNEEPSEENCPVCNETASRVCPCGHSDKHCSNGHSWYTNREGETITGNPHQK